MKNFFKKISEFLFGKKDALSKPCAGIYKKLEEVKNSYKEIKTDLSEISNEEFMSLSLDDQRKVVEYEQLMGTSIDYKTGQPLVRERPIVSVKSDSPYGYTEVKNNLMTYTNNSKYDVELKNEETGEITIIKSGETVNNLKTGQYTSKGIIPEVNIDIVTSGYLRIEDDPFPKPGIITTSTSENPPKITFFHPNDNKEIKLDEKKSEEIKATKKKRQYKKKGKK